MNNAGHDKKIAEQINAVIADMINPMGVCKTGLLKICHEQIIVFRS